MIAYDVMCVVVLFGGVCVNDTGFVCASRSLVDTSTISIPCINALQNAKFPITQARKRKESIFEEVPREEVRSDYEDDDNESSESSMDDQDRARALALGKAMIRRCVFGHNTN